jgi:hypothetical protein
MMRTNDFSIQTEGDFDVFFLTRGSLIFFSPVKGLPETLCRGWNQRFLFPNLGETGQ